MSDRAEPALVPNSPADPSVDWRRLAAGTAMIVLAAFAVYWPALRGQFLWDDELVVHRNPLVTGELGLASIWFRTDFPLSSVVLWLEWMVWGNHPAGYHVVNVLLHAVSALLLWRLLAQLRITAAWLAAMIFAVHPVCVASVAWISELKNTLSLPFFLFSLLCYVRLEAAPSTPYLPPTGAALRNLAAPSSPLRYGLSLLAFTLALLAKTSTVMLPVVLLGWVWWQHGRITRRDWLRVVPFFVLAGAFGLMSIWFQAQGAISGATVQSENLFGRLAAAGMALWFYIGKALLPLNLCMIYPRWTINAGSVTSYLPLLLWCGLVAVCWGVSRASSAGAHANEPPRRDERRESREGESDQSTQLSVTDSQATETSSALRSSRLCGLMGHASTATLRRARSCARHLLFGLGCFTVTLFPVLGFFDMFFLALSRVSDHFVYLPLTALVGLVAAGLGWGGSRMFQTPEGSKHKSHADSSARSLMSIASLRPKNQAPSGAACDPPPAREPSMPLLPELENSPLEPGDYKHAAPDGATAPAQGDEMSGLRGRVIGLVVGTGLVVGLGVLAAQRAQVFVNEETLWRDTLARNPAAWCAHANLGWILAGQQKFDDAREHLEAALSLKSDNAQAHSNLGRVLMRQGSVTEANEHFLVALKIKPNDTDIRRSYAAALAEQGRRAEAMEQLREALRVRPQPDARLQLATLLYQTGKASEAVAEYRLVLEVKPDQPEALNNLAWLLATSSDATLRVGAEAVRLAERACRLSGYKQARELTALAAAYAEAGKFTEAVETMQKGVAVANAEGNTRFAAVGEQLLKLFREGKPYHLPTPIPTQNGPR